MITMITRLFLASFLFCLPTIPLVSVNLLFYVSTIRSISSIANYEGSFYLGTPTDRVMCQVSSIHGYSTMQGKRQFVSCGYYLHLVGSVVS